MGMGLSEKATKAEIKSKFRELSKTYHPDKNQGNEEAAEKMKSINMANDVLSSSTRKKGYDNMLKMRRAMDAPRESPVVVFIGLFLLVSFIVLQYQNAQYKELKTAILKEAKVRRAFEARGKADSTDDASLSKKEKKKKKKEKKKKEINLDEYDDAVLTEIMKEVEITAPKWTGQKPSFTD